MSEERNADRQEPKRPTSLRDCSKLLRRRADLGRRSAFEQDFYALSPLTQATLFGIAAELEYIAEYLDATPGR